MGDYTRRIEKTEAPRRCPECRGAMERYRTRGVDLDRCDDCRGVWFDMHELADAARCPLPPVTSTGPSDRRCPCCRVPLEKRRMGPVVIDGCGTCHGVYLDAGEFKLLRRGRRPVRQREWSELSKPRYRDGGRLPPDAFVGVLSRFLE